MAVWGLTGACNKGSESYQRSATLPLVVQLACPAQACGSSHQADVYAFAVIGRGLNTLLLLAVTRAAVRTGYALLLSSQDSAMPSQAVSEHTVDLVVTVSPIWLHSTSGGLAVKPKAWHPSVQTLPSEHGHLWCELMLMSCTVT